MIRRKGIASWLVKSIPTRLRLIFSACLGKPIVYGVKIYGSVHVPPSWSPVVAMVEVEQDDDKCYGVELFNTRWGHVSNVTVHGGKIAIQIKG